jgi:hypothetical protein
MPYCIRLTISNASSIRFSAHSAHGIDEQVLAHAPRAWT